MKIALIITIIFSAWFSAAQLEGSPGEQVYVEDKSEENWQLLLEEQKLTERVAAGLPVAVWETGELYGHVSGWQPTPVPIVAASATPAPAPTRAPATRSPVATPKPVLQVASVDSIPTGGVEEAIRDAFGSNFDWALCVARKESGLNPNAVGRQGERGLFQIHPVHFTTFSAERLFDSYYNAAAAARIYQSSGPRAWTTAGGC